MQAETKEQILSIINRRLAVLLPAVVLSILVLWIMYAQVRMARWCLSWRR